MFELRGTWSTTLARLFLRGFWLALCCEFDRTLAWGSGSLARPLPRRARPHSADSNTQSNLSQNPAALVSCKIAGSSSVLRLNPPALYRLSGHSLVSREH